MSKKQKVMKTQNLIPIGGHRSVNPQRVVALVADVNYTYAHLDDGKVVVVATPLKTLAARFESDIFFRTHKSYLINLSFVESYDKVHHHFVIMPNNLRAEVARRKRTAFRATMQNLNSLIIS